MKRLIIVLLFFVIIFSSCTFGKVKDDQSWKNEVLVVSECGMDGLSCCLGEETLCLYEQECCYDPRNVKNTYCAESCEQGVLNSFCRIEGGCNDGLACRNGRCFEAGGENEPCLEESKCEEGLVCYKENCVVCGLVSNPCCKDSDYPCLENDRNKERIECIFGTCQKCGTDSLNACPSEPFCEKFNLLNNNKCLGCGEFNKPCCSAEEGGEACIDGLECKLGFCNN